jgi:hypothetical protein
VPRGATINRATAGSSQVLRYVRRHMQVTALLHKTMRVEPSPYAPNEMTRRLFLDCTY